MLNFGYILYLSLKDMKVTSGVVETLVRKWIVLSILTGRYSGSAESAIDYDINARPGPGTVPAKEPEAGELSDAFWNTVLLQRLDTSVSSSVFSDLPHGTGQKGRTRVPIQPD